MNGRVDTRLADLLDEKQWFVGGVAGKTGRVLVLHLEEFEMDARIDLREELRAGL